MQRSQKQYLAIRKLAAYFSLLINVWERRLNSKHHNCHSKFLLWMRYKDFPNCLYVVCATLYLKTVCHFHRFDVKIWLPIHFSANNLNSLHYSLLQPCGALLLSWFPYALLWIDDVCWFLIFTIFFFFFFFGGGGIPIEA